MDTGRIKEAVETSGVVKKYTHSEGTIYELKTKNEDKIYMMPDSISRKVTPMSLDSLVQ